MYGRDGVSRSVGKVEEILRWNEEGETRSRVPFLYDVPSGGMTHGRAGSRRRRNVPMMRGKEAQKVEFVRKEKKGESVGAIDDD